MAGTVSNVGPAVIDTSGGAVATGTIDVAEGAVAAGPDRRRRPAWSTPAERSPVVVIAAACGGSAATARSCSAAIGDAAARGGGHRAIVARDLRCLATCHPAAPGDRPRILLDCDPGHDDVVAITVAALLHRPAGDHHRRRQRPARPHHVQRLCDARPARSRLRPFIPVRSARCSPSSTRQASSTVRAGSTAPTSRNRHTAPTATMPSG